LRVREWSVAGLGLALALSLGQALAEPTSDQKDAGNPAPQTAPETPPKSAGQTAPPSAPAPPADKTKGAEGKTAAPASGTSNDRLMFALPNFLTLENSAHVPPLTTGQKFRVVVRSSFDYVQLPWYGFLSGISQAENSEPGYGQGAAGYGKRFGAAAADGTIENFMTSAIFPSLFHEDPRYFQLGKGSFAHRAEYSVSRILITRSDSGHQQLNISEIFGSAMAAAISTYGYHPRADKTLANAGEVWGTEVSYDTLTIVLKEFWPDIRRKIRKKKNGQREMPPGL
jgi:hypothetical protein